MQVGTGVEARFHPLFRGGEEGKTARLAAGNDADLLNRVVVGHQGADQGVAALVIRHQALALLAHHPVFFLRASHDALDGVVDLIHGNFGELPAGRQDRGLIEQIGQISAGIARGAARHLVEVHILGQGLAAGMDLKDLKATAVIGAIHHHLAIKTARP